MCLDSCKRPAPVSDHEVFALWVVAYRRFNCITFWYPKVLWCPLKKHAFRYSLLLLLAPPKIIVPDPDPVVRAFSGAYLWISVTGTPPISITLKNDSAVLQHGTKDITHRLTNEGNYSCIAVNDYGNITIVNFSVVFIGAYFHYHM